MTFPNYADPDHPACKISILKAVDHMTSAVVLGLSLAGRWYAPKIGVTRFPFTVSALRKILGFIRFSGSYVLLLGDP